MQRQVDNEADKDNYFVHMGFCFVLLSRLQWVRRSLLYKSIFNLNFNLLHVQWVFEFMQASNNFVVPTYILLICLFDLLGWVFFIPSREFFTHMVTSQMSEKGCNFWNIVGIKSWSSGSEGSLAYHTYTVTRGIHL